jgi:hypothetical protein
MVDWKHSVVDFLVRPVGAFLGAVECHIEIFEKQVQFL